MARIGGYKARHICHNVHKKRAANATRLYSGLPKFVRQMLAYLYVFVVRLLLPCTGLRCRLCRGDYPCNRHGTIVGFFVGVDSCGSCFTGVDRADPMGRPDVAGRIERVQGLRNEGSVQADSGRMVTTKERGAEFDLSDGDEHHA